MRTRHWLAVMLGGCMALAGVGTSSAQPPMMPSNGNPDQAGMGLPPSPYAPAYGPTQQYYSGLEGPGYPPNATAWPNISPFAGPPVDSVAYEDGFWFNRILQGNRKYYFSAEALLARTQGGTETLIGAPGVNPVSIDALQGNTVSGTAAASNLLGGTTQFDQSVFTTGPYRYINASANGGGGNGGAGSIGSPTIFGAQTTGVLSGVMATGGFRGTWGWFNPDDSGFVVSGFVQGQATSNWSLYDPLLDINPNSGNYNVLNHLHAWFGVPLGNSGLTTSYLPLTTGSLTNAVSPPGDTDGNGLYGAVQPYDMGVFIRFTSQLMGANSDWYFNSIYEQPAFKVRPLVGARYVHLQETFSFDGYDSGMGYTVNNPGNSAGGGGGGGGGGGTVFSGYLTPLALDPFFSIPNVLHSHLVSSDISQMAGPEAGFRIDLGKSNSKFQMWGNTKFAALANVTSRQITGYGIGNGFNIAGQTNGVANTVPTMPNNPQQTAFSTQQTTTSMSPMFEQSINVKFPVFDMIPYINKLEIFERAQLQAGYTFMYIGSVYRPQNTIIWNQYPLTPQLNGQKSDFFNHNFNLGVEWTY